MSDKTFGIRVIFFCPTCRGWFFWKDNDALDLPISREGAVALKLAGVQQAHTTCTYCFPADSLKRRSEAKP